MEAGLGDLNMHSVGSAFENAFHGAQQSVPYTPGGELEQGVLCGGVGGPGFGAMGGDGLDNDLPWLVEEPLCAGILGGVAGPDGPDERL